MPGVGGLSDIVWSLAEELHESGHHVEIIGIYNLVHIKRNAAVRATAIIPSKRQNIITHAWNAIRVVRAAKSRRPDIIHSSDVLTAAASCLFGMGQRTVYHAHQNFTMHARRSPRLPWSPSMYALLRVASLIACRRCARMISFGPSLDQDWIRVGVDPQRLVHLPNGISRQVPVARCPVPGRVLYVGRLSLEKGGVEEMISALNFLPCEIHLVIAGDGPMRDSTAAFVERLGLGHRVSLVGQQSPQAIAELYASAELVVLPSRNEMMPRVMLEAWRAGVPFAGTRVGAIPDYVKDGINGYLSPDVSPDAIASTVKQAMGNPVERNRIAAKASEELSSFAWSNIAGRLVEDVYEPIQNGVSNSWARDVGATLPVR
jgi:glycosyltransferase involved in cell wall biosynthesis